MTFTRCVLSSALALVALGSPGRLAFASINAANFPPPAVRLTMDSGTSQKPRVALDGSGNAVVVWQDDRYGNNEILWQKFRLDGTALTNIMRLTNTAGSSVRPDIACLGDTSYVVWQEGEASGVGDVYLTRRDANGQPIRPDVTEISLAGDARVAAVPGGYADVVWGRRASVDQDLYYRRHKPAGDVLCQQRLFDGTIADVPKTPVLAEDGSTNAKFLWSDLNQWFSYVVVQGGVSYLCAPTMSDICGVQGINPTIDMAGSHLARLYEYGGRIYEAGGCCAIAGAGSATLPSTGTTPDTSYAVWQDTRDGNSEIYFCQYQGCNNLSGDLRLTQNAGASERPDIAVNHLTGEWVVVWQQVVDGNYEIYMTSSRLVGSTAAFLIPSATFDKRLYQNGTDVATVRVVTQSVTGNNPSLSLHATVRSNLQDSFDLGSDAFAMSPGGQHVSTFSWPVPSRTQTCDFSLHVELRSGSQILATVDLPHATTATPMSAAEIDQKNAAVMNDQCVPPVDDCTSFWIGMIPVYPDAQSFLSFQNAACASGQDVKRGDYCRAVVDALQAAIPTVELALAAEPGPGSAADLVLQAIDYFMSCHLDVSKLCGGSSARFSTAAQTDPDLDSIAVAVRNGSRTFGNGYAYEILSQGDVSARVGVGDQWTTVDSLALTKAFVFRTIGASTRWAHVGQGPVAVGSSDSNSHSRCVARFAARSAGQLGVRLVDHARSDSILAYLSVPLRASSIVSLALSDTATSLPLQVDLDGDGRTDFYYYPGGTVVGVPGGDMAVAGPPGIIALQPNPANRATTIFYRLVVGSAVHFQIYDVSGRKRAEIDGGFVPPGLNTLRWNGQGDAGGPLAPGTYFVRLAAGQQRSAAKLILVR